MKPLLPTLTFVLLVFCLPNQSAADNERSLYATGNLRHSLLTGKFMLTQVDARMAAGNFVCGIGHTKYEYAGISEKMLFETLDLEIVGLTTNPESRTVFTFTLGAMLDLRTNTTLPQYTTSLSRRLENDIKLETRGRVLASSGKIGRSELVVSGMYPVYRFNKLQSDMSIGLYGMVASYNTLTKHYPMESFGFTLRLNL